MSTFLPSAHDIKKVLKAVHLRAASLLCYISGSSQQFVHVQQGSYEGEKKIHNVQQLEEIAMGHFGKIFVVCERNNHHFGGKRGKG